MIAFVLFLFLFLFFYARSWPLCLWLSASQIVQGRENARKVVDILMANPDVIYGCDTEVSELDLKVKKESTQKQDNKKTKTQEWPKAQKKKSDTYVLKLFSGPVRGGGEGTRAPCPPHKRHTISYINLPSLNPTYNRGHSSGEGYTAYSRSKKEKHEDGTP